VSIENEEHNPDDAEDGEWSPSTCGRHPIELNAPHKGSCRHHYGKPGATKPDSGDEEWDEDCGAEKPLA
jgi:hypothetical protein